MRMLQKFLSDDESRSKAKTIVSGHSTLSDDRGSWRQLRKELQDAGISPKSFSENLDLIIAIFQKSFVADMPDLETVTSYMIDGPEEFFNSQSDMSRASIVSNTNESTSSIWDMDVLRRLDVLGGSDHQRVDPASITATNDLIPCAKKGDLRAVIQMIDGGCDVNALNEFGDSALSLAAAEGHRDIVLALFSKGAKVGTMNQNREGALVQAARAGHIEVLNILMAHVEPIDDYQYHMALGAAAEKGHTDVVRLLLDRGVDPNHLDADDEDANTPLFKAAGNGHDKIIRVLLDHGAKPNTLNFWSESAMFAACRSKEEKSARLLLKFGASLDRKAESIADYPLWKLLHDDSQMRR